MSCCGRQETVADLSQTDVQATERESTIGAAQIPTCDTHWLVHYGISFLSSQLTTKVSQLCNLLLFAIGRSGHG